MISGETDNRDIQKQKQRERGAEAGTERETKTDTQRDRERKTDTERYGRQTQIQGDRQTDTETEADREIGAFLTPSQARRLYPHRQIEKERELEQRLVLLRPTPATNKRYWSQADCVIQSQS